MNFKIHNIKEVDSTNTYARRLLLQEDCKTDFCVVATYQSFGKGQLGASWQSQNGKNLTFSVVLKNLKLDINEQFMISALTSLNLIKALNSLGFFKLKLKWPNDIISGQSKIAGVLIENILQSKWINTSIIGVGLNVNQTEFTNLPQASSLKKLTGIHYNLDEILHQILLEFQKIPIQLKTRSMLDVFDKYHRNLFRREQASMFKFPNGNIKPGIIQGVKENGCLRVLFEDDEERNFDVKDIKLLY